MSVSTLVASVARRVDRLSAALVGVGSKLLWALALGSIAAGLVAWGAGAGFVALWLFVAAAVIVALVLPFTLALVSPLFMGLLGWLVDMLPLVILAGWGAVVLRWAIGLLLERRLPRGGRWIWLPIGLVVWTSLGVLVTPKADLRHFLLLLGIQVVISGALLAAVDRLRGLEDRLQVMSGVVAFLVVMSIGVLLQWIGVPVEDLQDETVSERAEEAYGLDAFPNEVGMIKYARSSEAGAGELRRELRSLSAANPAMPAFEVFSPKFGAFENYILVRFAGSARPVEDELARIEVDLHYDNVGLAPANTVPRLRSFARNSLTYAGASAALLPLAFVLAWSEEKRRKWLGWAGVAACFFGAGFSLARGAWVAILIGVVYLLVDGVISRRQKRQVVTAFLVAAAVLTAVFLVKYGVDPVRARAGGDESIATRSDLYEETVESIRGLHLILGFGTERPRTESGVTHEGAKYIPRAGTHSTYLNYLFRAGIVGALAILAVYVLAWAHARAAARVTTGLERTAATLAATSVLIAAAHGVILSLYVEPIYTLAVSLLLGLAVAGATALPASIVPWRKTSPAR